MTYPLEGSVAGTIIEGGQPRLIAEDQLPSATRRSAVILGPTMSVPLLARGGVLGALTVSRNQGSHTFHRRRPRTRRRLRRTSQRRHGNRRRPRRQTTDDAPRRPRPHRARPARPRHPATVRHRPEPAGSPRHAAPRNGRAYGIEQAITNIDLAISQIRTAIFALSSAQSERGDTFRHRVIDLVNELAGAMNNDPQLGFAGPVDTAITGELAEDVLAVVRESLTNTVKHAQATQVVIVPGRGGRNCHRAGGGRWRRHPGRGPSQRPEEPWRTRPKARRSISHRIGTRPIQRSPGRARYSAAGEGTK